MARLSQESAVVPDDRLPRMAEATGCCVTCWEAKHEGHECSLPPCTCHFPPAIYTALPHKNICPQYEW